LQDQGRVQPSLSRKSKGRRAPSATQSAGFEVAHFRFCREGGSQQISPGNRSGGSRHRRRGHAATARRSARVSRPQRLARPTGLPRSSQSQVSEVFVLAKLTPNEGDLSVKHLGGVRRPAPSAGAFQSGVQQTTAQHQKAPAGWPGRVGEGIEPRRSHQIPAAAAVEHDDRQSRSKIAQRCVRRPKIAAPARATLGLSVQNSALCVTFGRVPAPGS
jgi:hypothetical protein